MEVCLRADFIVSEALDLLLHLSLNARKQMTAAALPTLFSNKVMSS
jgi:hypothetical protein